MKRFCLVRHGQTDWNVEGRYQGQSDVPLSGAGRAEVHSLARKLIGQSFAAIYTSDLKRAMETAEIIADALHMPITPEPLLREINQGEWEGQSVEVIRDRYAELWKQRTNDLAKFQTPGGESVAEVAERVNVAMRNIAHLYPIGSVLIVSHGLALATIICREQGIPVGLAYHRIPENAEPIWVDWKE